MPVITFASPKGGVGKSTCAVVLAGEISGLDVPVTLLDCDPNGSASLWAAKGATENVEVISGVTAGSLVPLIKQHDRDGRVVIVDLEGVASQLVSRAIAQADLVIVPMQPTALDSAIGSRALSLVYEEEEALGRSIRSAVVLTKTGAIRSRVQRELEEQLEAAGVDVLRPGLDQRAAFGELFALGGTLSDMLARQDVTTAGNVAAAKANAAAFAAAVLDRLLSAEKDL